MSANRTLPLLLALALVAGCKGRDSGESGGGDRFGGSSDNAAAVEIVDETGNVIHAAGPVPMAWRFAEEAAGPAASYGDGANVAFALRCDRKAQQIVIQQAATGAGEPVLEIEAEGGGAARYEGRSIGGTVPRVEARTALDDPFLDRMAAPAARLSVRAGSDDPVAIPGGRAIRRIVEQCRAPAETPIEGATYAGMIPCADCPGIDVRLTLTPPGAPQPRYRAVYRYRERGATSFTGPYSVLQGERGPVYQLLPQGAGSTIFVEQVAPDRLVYRTPSNERDPMLERHPLTLVVAAPPPETPK